MPSTNSSLLFWQTREEVSIVLDAPFLFLWVTNNEIFAKNILPFCLKRHQEGQKETRKQKRLWHSFLRYMQTQ